MKILKIKWKKEKTGAIYCSNCGFAFLTPCDDAAFGIGWNKDNHKVRQTFQDWETGVNVGFINYCPSCGLERVHTELVDDDVAVTIVGGKICS